MRGRGFLVSWFLGFLVSWFQSFLGSKFLGFFVSKFQRFTNSISCFLIDIAPLLKIFKKNSHAFGKTLISCASFSRISKTDLHDLSVPIFQSFHFSISDILIFTKTIFLKMNWDVFLDCLRCPGVSKDTNNWFGGSVTGSKIPKS